MNYNQAMGQSLEFIEENIKAELTPEQIAKNVGYSTFHFCRLFALNQGVSLMDYVRKRRLLLARDMLLSHCKIIEAAMDYGFETASGFSKAFRKEFGYSPTAYIARMTDFNITEIINNIGGIIMEPIIIKKDEFKIAGYGINTNIAESFTKDVAAYWDTYNGENLESKMYRQLNPPKHGEVGVCVTSSDNGNAVYLLGVIVDSFEKVTPDMMTLVVPEAEYAVFTTPSVNNATSQSYGEDPLSIAVKKTWKYIFNEWFPQSGYEFDETKVDFEFYDERCHGEENLVMDIYVPIISKKS